jgi:hypothetical protein
MVDHVLDFENFVLLETILSEEYSKENLTESEIDNLLNEVENTEVELNESMVVFISIFAILATTALMHIASSIKKQIQINKLIKKEADSTKRAKLKLALKKETELEIDLRRQVVKLKAKAKAKAESTDQDVDPKKIEKAKKKIEAINSRIKRLELQRKTMRTERLKNTLPKKAKKKAAK